MDIAKILAKEFGVRELQVKRAIELFDQGNTIPFIARYRKEKTGGLSDIVLRELSERVDYIRSISNRREDITRLIKEQGSLTDKLEHDIKKASTLQKLEDLYRPFKPKRRTRAMMAKEKGLDPLAKLILAQRMDDVKLELEAKEYTSELNQVADQKEALEGAMDIIAEMIADDPGYRELVRNKLYKESLLRTSKIKDKGESKKESEDKSVYETYFEYEEPVSKLVSYKVLAINRAEKEKAIRVKIDSLAEAVISLLKSRVVDSRKIQNRYLEASIEDSYKRLMFPSIEREIRAQLTEMAEGQAIKVFGRNLKPLLLQAPIKNVVVMGFDPAYRTGCKIAVLDGTGKLLDYTTVFPIEPKNRVEESKKELKEMIDRHGVDLIAIGNGTGSRESERFIAELIGELERDVHYSIVNEAGASVYSASKLGAQEHPELDVSIRGALSIGRRLQDPLAELVKIDPKHIGIGQYQHDLNQKHLDEVLGGVVEDCVNSVGVDLNTASVSLLGYVAGISSSIAQNIVDYRDSKGKFKNRKELLKVNRLGSGAFIQSAGFLRILDGENVLDRTGIHPESYEQAERLLARLSVQNIESDLKNVDCVCLEENAKDLSEELGIGEITLRDMIIELQKPGRDPREDMPKPVFRTDVLKLEDLKSGMILQGTVRNVVDFGAFVDIGVKQDGLVHISHISDRFVKNPMDVVSVGDEVNVKVLDIDMEKNRISLSIKEADDNAYRI